MNASLLQCRCGGLAWVCLLLAAATAPASAVLFGDYYRLGDDDPGAAAGLLGHDPTLDSGTQHLDLARSGTPQYSADTSPSAVGSKWSMLFTNPGSAGLGPPATPSLYSLGSPLTTAQPGYGVETWVKTSTLAPVDASGYALIAYNGSPLTSGFGLLQHGSSYVASVGGVEKVLTKASTTDWTHLAYVHWGDTDSFYLNGVDVGDVPAAGSALPTTGGFLLGGNPLDSQHADLFNGLIDETRFFAFNPLAAGAGGFSPTDFLITSPVPEPSSLLALGGLLLLLRPGRARNAGIAESLEGSRKG